MWLGNEYLSHVLDNRILWTKQPIRRFVIGVIAMLAYTIVMTYAITWFSEITMNIRGASFTDMIYGTVITTSIITLFMTSRSFLFEWKNAAVQSEKLKKESMVARYENLKSQVNPHFLFNSLNVLTNLVYEDQDKAAKFIKQLSEVYRYVLDTREREVVPLQEELKFMESYVYLQQIRFGSNLKVNIDRELKLRDTRSQVVPLAMQMLVENAIKHNVISSEMPLEINLYEKDNYVVVENNLQIKKLLPGESPGLGLENIKNRYSFLSDHQVEIFQDDKKFLVKIPILEMK